MMDRNEQIEKVIDVFGEYIDSIPEIDIAATRKGKYLFLIDDEMADEIESGEWLCNRLLGEIELDMELELKTDGEPIPQEYRQVLCSRLQPYLDKLPGYNHLLENYK